VVIDFLAALFMGAVVFLTGFLLVINALEHHWWQARLCAFLAALACLLEFRVIKDAIDKYGGD
jgi:hypothetical protein